MSRRNRLFLALGLGVTLLLAGILSTYASSSPDGLERVAEDFGFADTADDHPTSGSPFSDYSADGVDDPGLAGGLAGVTGVLVTVGVSVWLFRLLGRRGTPADSHEPGDGGQERGDDDETGTRPRPRGPVTAPRGRDRERGP